MVTHLIKKKCSVSEDDEYQAQNEDEEDDEQTIEEEERLNSEDEQNELDDLQAVSSSFYCTNKLQTQLSLFDNLRMPICR